MKSVLTWLVIITFAFGIWLTFYLHRDRVEQSLIKDDSRILCPSGTCFQTIVWYNDDIIKSRYDDLNNLNDSIANVRKNEAEKLLNTINKNSK